MSHILHRETGVRQSTPHPDELGSLSELFHENTKLWRPIMRRPAEEDSYSVRDLEAMARAYKRYRLHPQIPLARAGGIAGPAVGEVIEGRRSRRTFTDKELPLDELSTVLRWSYGVTGETRMAGGGVQRFRAAPSAGALYPAELYLGVRTVTGLDPGIYHYEVESHALALLSRGDQSERIQSVCCGQEHVSRAGVVVFISAVFERPKQKYGDRSYRYVLLDIGHLGQNLWLACSAFGLSMVTTCGFFDDEAADLLGIDGCDEAVIYVAFIGSTPKERA